MLLFIGFSGQEKITLYASWIHPISQDTTGLIYNLLVFFLFVVGILHLVFRFSEKQSSAEKAVAALAALGNEIQDDITLNGNIILVEQPNKIALIRTRYEAIAENLPANSDSEFFKALNDLSKKQAAEPRLIFSPQNMLDTQLQERLVASIALSSRTIVDALTTLRAVDPALYIGGGLVRNAVWDFLHGYTTPTAVDDVDVIHFDTQSATKLSDQKIQDQLKSVIPNINWSVKNQARMHEINGENAYTSLNNAISHWPETATALVVQLTEDDKLKFIAPYGFDDLLRLLIVNTPAFENRISAITARIEKKQWLRTWPRLKVMLPKSCDEPVGAGAFGADSPNRGSR